MKTYYFSDTNWKQHFNITTEEISNILKNISYDTNTDDLILAIYFIRLNSGNGGVAYVRNWLTQNEFISYRGRWNFTKNFSTPHDLPEKFKLIRLQFSTDYLQYPLRQQDSYNWEHSYSTFKDHLAFLFAHELHHFRRFHLGFHHREGENSANKWAIQRAQKLNFKVAGKKILPPKKTSFSKFIQAHIHFDIYKKYRKLVTGDQLIIKFDPQGRYLNEPVTVVRPIRKNSRRIVVKTNDGKQWRWPMEWVAIAS